MITKNFFKLASLALIATNFLSVECSNNNNPDFSIFQSKIFDNPKQTASNIQSNNSIPNNQTTANSPLPFNNYYGPNANSQQSAPFYPPFSSNQPAPNNSLPQYPNNNCQQFNPFNPSNPFQPLPPYSPANQSPNDNMAQNKLNELNDKIKQLTKANQNLSNEKETLEKSSEKQQAKIDDLKEKNKKLNGENKNSQQTIEKLEKKIKKQEDKISELEKQIDSAANKNANAMQQQETKIEVLKKEIEELTKSKQQLDNQNKAKDSQNISLRNEKSNLEKNIQNQQTQNQKLTEENNQLHQELDKLKRQVDELKNQIEQEKKGNQSKDEEIKKLEADVKLAFRDSLMWKNDALQYKDERNCLESDFQSAKDYIKLLEQKLEDLRGALRSSQDFDIAPKTPNQKGQKETILYADNNEGTDQNLCCNNPSCCLDSKTNEDKNVDDSSNHTMNSCSQSLLQTSVDSQNSSRVETSDSSSETCDRGSCNLPKCSD